MSGMSGMGVNAMKGALSNEAGLSGRDTVMAVAAALLALRHVTSADQSTMIRVILHDNSARVFAGQSVNIG